MKLFTPELIVQLIGIAFATLIPLLILIFTLKSNKKTQIKNNNIQIALTWQNSVSTEINKAHQSVTEAYNNIDKLLILCASLKPQGRDMGKYIEQVNEIYILFRQSMNNVKYNTDIYTVSIMCEGCTLCDIKTYGDLAKATIRLQTVFISIDEEVCESINLLSVALDSASETIDIIERRSTTQNIVDNYRSMISLSESKHYIDDKLKQDVLYYNAQMNKEISEIEKFDNIISSKMDVTKQKNEIARNKINDIYIKHKPQLDEAIFSYFAMYKRFAKQGVLYIQKNGRPNNMCKKITDEVET